jgi:uncharacterized repeat protein (TIGR01451 family)
MTKSHVGNFTVGQQGDYTLSVANTGPVATSGPITIVDTLPAGLTYVTGTGTGWSCTQAGQVVTCVSNAVIPPSSVDPSIDIKVSVTATTPGTVTNSATASGGGATNTATASDPTVILPAPPALGITKTHTGNFTVGAVGTYTVTPSNSGGSATSGTLTVIDTLPAGLTYNSASGNGWTCSAAGQTVTCTSTAAVAAGSSANPITLNVNVAAAAVPTVTNTASATGGGASNTASASDPTAVNGAPVLAANKSHTGNFVIGTTNTYTLSVGNTGTSATAGTLTYVDTLPAGLTYNAASGTGWSCSAAGQVVTCTSAQSVAKGATSTPITLTVNVVGPTPGTVTNTGKASGGGATGTSTKNDPTTLIPNQAIAGGVKSHTGNFVVGQNAVYTIAPQNTGVQPTAGTVKVVDVLPAGLTYVSATGSGWTCSAVGQTVTCTSPQIIPAGGSATPITLTVAVGAAAFPSVTNSATISFAGSGGGTGAGSSTTASDTAQVDQGPRLVASKTHAGNFTVGTPGVWTLGVSNTGSAATSGTITLTDNLQAGLTFVSAVGTNWMCGAASQAVTCTTNAVLAIGQAAPTIALTVNVGAAAVGTFNNVNVPSGGNAAFYVNATNGTTVKGIPLLALSKTHSGTFYANLQAAYTLTPSNPGSAATAGTLTITDTLPAGLTFVSAFGPGWTCTAAGQVVTCTSAVVIPAGGTGNPITLNVLPQAAAVPGVTNTATLSGGGAATPATASDPTVVAVAPVIGISKTHTGNFVAGQNGTYTITPINSGLAPTAGTYTMVDTLPAGLTYVSAAGTGWTCGAAGQVVTCTSSTVIGASGIGKPISLTVATAPSAVPSVTNTAASSGGGAPNTGGSTDVTTVTIPALSVAKTHTGNFVVGSTGSYSIAVTNTGNATTFGTTTIRDTLPAGLTFASAAGTGWTCTNAAPVVTCTSANAVAAGAAFPTLSLVVNAIGPAGTVTNSVTASGGGATNTPSASDPTLLAQPVLAIAKSHTGNFSVGQPGVYTISVSNTGNAATSGTLTVVDPIPAAFTYTSAAGTGWTCGFAAPNLTCTSTAPIAAGASGNPITLTVGVPMSAVGTQTNSATASGGGAANTPTASDPTVVTGAPILSIAKSHAGNFTAGQTGTFTITVGNTGNLNTSGTVTVTDPLPAGLTFASASGTGWACTGGATVTCTSAAVIAAGGTGATIALVVNVAPNAPASITNTATAAGGAAANSPHASDTVTIVAPVLAVAKSHTGNFSVGQPGVYTIAVSNTGTAATFGTITVVDPIPAAFTYTSAAGTGWSCSFAAPNLTCTSTASIAAGGTGSPITLTVGVPMSAVGTQTNTATAAGGGAVNTPKAADPTVVTGTTVLSIAKSHSGSFIAGQSGTYTISVGNTGTVNTSGTITVSDPLPAGLTFSSASGTGWTCTGGTTVTCTSTGVIAAGGTGPPIALVVNVASGAPSTITNTASAAGGGAANTPSASDPTVIVRPVLAIAKSHGGTFVVGKPGVYTIAVSNTGTAATFGPITVVDPIPSPFTYTSAAGTGWTCSFAAPNVTCTSSAPIASGAAGNPITLTVGVPMSAIGTITNTASASGGGAANAPVASDPTTVTGNPVLAVVKSHTGNFVAGQPGVYTIAVSNTGNVNTAGAVTVVDTLPAGLTYTSATGTGWSCAASGQTVTCTSPAVIAAGAAAPPIALTVGVAQTAVPSVVNTATASGGGAANPVTATDPTTVTAPVLSIKKSHTGTFSVGQTGTYTIAVSNTGSAATFGTITVSDTLPAGLTYSAAGGTAWSCSASGQTVTCTSGAIVAAGGAAAPIALTVNVLPAAIPSVTNTATAAGGGAANQPSSSDPTTIGGQPVIVGPGGGPVEKLVNGQRSVASPPGSTVTYTITFVNTGNANAANVVLTDPFPAGITPIPGTVTINGSTSGFTSTISGQTLIITIPSLAPNVTQSVAVQATVSSTATPGQTFVNVASLSATGLNPVTTNPATVFNGAADIVYDGLIGSGAPIGGAIVTIVNATTGVPVNLGASAPQRAAAARTAGASTENPQTTGANGMFGFALSPAIYGSPGQTMTYRLTVTARGFRDRNIQLTFVGGASGLVYNVTLTALDGQPLAVPGGFALEPGPTTIANVLNLLNNIPMFRRSGGLDVEKSGDRSTVAVGDRVVFTIAIQPSVPLTKTRIVDQLPAGLAYAPHSATFDGVPLEPSVNGRTLVWQLASLNTDRHILKYAAVVDSGASPGSTLVNTVTVDGQPAAGGPILSGTAQAAVATVPGSFTDRLTIVGRVVIGSADGGWTSVSRGVAGVKILLEDGTTVTTDKQGRYSFPAVRPGMHVLRLDESSLPANVKANGTHAYNDPLSTVRLVHTVMDTRLLQDIIFVVEER